MQVDVRRFYWSLTAALIVGCAAAGVALGVAKPGPGNISVAGATAGTAIVTLVLATVLLACLWFMDRVTLVIAAAGGSISSRQYKALMKVLLAGLGLAVVIGAFARPAMSSATIAKILIAVVVALLAVAIVLATFLWFLRAMVSTSSIPDAPSVAKLYLGLIALAVVGLVIGGLVMGTASPGAGPIHVAGSALGIAIGAIVVAAVTLALLVYLASTVRDATEVQENPAKGRHLRAGPEAGMATDPGVVYPAESRTGDPGRAVEDIEGIGPTYAARLKEKCGITGFEQLRIADPGPTAQAIGTTAANVEAWQRMIHLMDIKGIGPQYAEILVMAGVQTPEQLAAANPAALKATIDGIEARRKSSRVLKVNVEQGLVNRLVGFARQHVGAE